MPGREYTPSLAGGVACNPHGLFLVCDLPRVTSTLQQLCLQSASHTMTQGRWTMEHAQQRRCPSLPKLRACHGRCHPLIVPVLLKQQASI